jgi:hypothetical protein
LTWLINVAAGVVFWEPLGPVRKTKATAISKEFKSDFKALKFEL